MKYINQILDAGVYPDLSTTEQRRVRLLNHMIFVALVPTLLFAILDIIMGHYEMLATVIVFAFAGTTSQILVRRRHYNAAKHLIMLTFIFALVGTVMIVGNQTGAYYMIVSFIIAPPLIFKARWPTLMYSVIILGGFIYAYEYVTTEDFEPAFELKDHLIRPYTFLVVLVIMIVIVMFTEFSKRLNEFYENQLRKKQEQIAQTLQELTDSLNYAQRLQRSILPDESRVKKYLPECFVLYKPKDIVAGDFYWLDAIEQEGKKPVVFLACADCTGHGVPGAMVSVVCANALAKAITEERIQEPSKILDRTREIVQTQFARHGTELQDGMDIALIKIEVADEICHITFSGAQRPLWIQRNGSEEIEEYRGDKQPVSRYEFSKPFTQETIDVRPGDQIFMTSDGMPDQFGGERGKKLKPKRMKDWIKESSNLTPKDQCQSLDQKFEDWKGDLEQIDDVCVIGIKVTQ